jgi:hypothetical protein
MTSQKKGKIIVHTNAFLQLSDLQVVCRFGWTPEAFSVMWGKTYTRKSKPAEGRSVAARDQVDSELVAKNRV